MKLVRRFIGSVVLGHGQFVIGRSTRYATTLYANPSVVSSHHCGWLGQCSESTAIFGNGSWLHNIHRAIGLYTAIAIHDKARTSAQ
ncbi:hypothetical protein EIP91_006942 [Steccherinum ochraceum]|uniref:Uncharacterized protein n=1 Tax=Steccherinum ochraceum TaxID=92696 RepID=A0A4R0RFG4_9APHY|nr:hypothetical protein EIP91_006942 [Steccherinum ochraceum]